MLVRIANGEDSDQTASSEVGLYCYKQSDVGLYCLARHFCQATSVRNFRASTIIAK